MSQPAKTKTNKFLLWIEWIHGGFLFSEGVKKKQTRANKQMPQWMLQSIDELSILKQIHLKRNETRRIEINPFECVQQLTVAQKKVFSKNKQKIYKFHLSRSESNLATSLCQWFGVFFFSLTRPGLVCHVFCSALSLLHLKKIDELNAID